MKRKFLTVGLIGLLLAGGLVLAGCGEKCPRSGADCDVSIDSTGYIYAGYAYCGNNDCATNKAKSNNKQGRTKCDC